MKPNNKFRVAGIGELLWDLLPDGKKLGGAPANFAFHAQALGAESTIVSSIGNDIPGAEIQEYLHKLDLNSNYITINNEKQTGVVNVTLLDGIPEYEIKSNVAWDYIIWDQSFEDLAQSIDAVCFGSLAQRSEDSCHTIQKFLKATKTVCLRVFDINLRQNFFNKKIISDSLDLASVLKLNDEELPVVAELFSLSGNEDIVLEKLIDIYKLELVALTKGNKGSFLKTKNENSFLEVPKVEVKDTVGAGDSFTAALIVAKLNGKSLKEMHKAANELAAFVCSKQGATPKMPKFLINNI
ncbi:MAG: carbohydrate kinase [Mariniphaga sp.]|nr:carbohydrate kinase [Mariniphaga sp.]